MKVKDVMHRGVEWVEPKTPITEIARKMRERTSRRSVGKMTAWWAW